MVPQKKTNKKIVFLYSDTGGGHRSSANAIIEAIDLEFPGLVDSKMVDIFRDYAPTPFDHAPEIYPQMTRMPAVWEASYRISDGKQKADWVTQMAWPYVRGAYKKLVRENPCDLFVSVHPLANRPILNVTKKSQTPFVTVVTDMVSAHAFWFDERADLVIVPTEEARMRAIQYGLTSAKVKAVGQPVADRFCSIKESKLQIREKLNWPADLPMILLVGGGEGMGPLESIAAAIDRAGLPVSMAIIAGRNNDLKEKLEQRQWNNPAHIYGFVKDMPEFMAAADVLVTKAGPGTISEAFIAGLPLILYSRLPGQEEGNVTYVVNNHAGVWAPRPDALVAVLKNWLDKPEKLAAVSAASKRLGKPEATRRIAQLLIKQLNGTSQDSSQSHQMSTKTMNG